MERATTAQRIGVLLAFFEACFLGLAAALHFGASWELGGIPFAAPLLYPAGILEAILAIALLVAIVLPGASTVRTGRVLAAQILVVIGIFIGEISLMRDVALATPRREIVDGVILAFALASIALIASPVYRQRRPVSG